MPYLSRAPHDRPVILFLHFLGGSARTWQAVTHHLDGVADCVTLDLPGFGDAQAMPGYTVTEMADRVEEALAAAPPRRWMAVGHSMGGKVAALLTRRAEDGAPGLAGLAGIVLLASSPPCPEPIAEDRRSAMLDWFGGDAAASRAQAETFISNNAGTPLPAPIQARAVDDVLRANRDAWRAWLQSGSREDWSGRIGVLQTPTLIVSGAEDADLGPAAQAKLTQPHFAHARMAVIPGAGHLLPLEQSALVAGLIEEHVAPMAVSR